MGDGGASAALPTVCRRDVETLTTRIRATRERRDPLDPRSPGAFRQVLVTGATGFIGRFLVNALLADDPELRVACLVRARDEAEGLDRVRDALVRGEQGGEAALDRVRPILGDVVRPRFGLAPARYETLSREVDAIYHLAADLRLAAPYESLRATNVAGSGHVLDLAVRGRCKHVFFASSLGVFPQYFRTFSDPGDRPVREGERPDPDDMRRTFPPGLMGYPWTKLVVEEILRALAADGLPVAVLRLPQTGKTSHGPAQPQDIQARIVAAMADVGLAPDLGKKLLFSEPADILGQAIAAISRRSNRRHLVYHCCEHEPGVLDFAPEDFGVALRKVSYDEFRTACRARGERSPLHAHWGLLDHMARWWFAPAAPRSTLPVEATALEADLGAELRWPGPLTREIRWIEWSNAHPDRWPLPLPKCRLDAEHLFARGWERAEREGLEFADACSETAAEALRRTVEGLLDPVARLRPARMATAAWLLGDSLRRAVDLAAELRDHPEIEAEPLRRPVFIVGMGRTGTTLLHRLLARDPRFQTLSSAELQEPFPHRHAGAADPGGFALARFRDLTEATGVAGALGGVHGIRPDEPEEDFALLRPSFRYWGSLLFCRMPEWYVDWLAASDMTEPYSLHATALRYFQRRRGPAARERTWLLKTPLHLLELDALLARYPDAVFIQTHRDPRRIVGSWCSLMERLHALAGEPYPRDALGREQLALIRRMMERSAAFRRAHPELVSRWIDVPYAELVADPAATAARIRERLGWAVDPQVERDTRQWLAADLATRRTEPSHRYHHADYGIDDAMIDDAFRSYDELVAPSSTFHSNTVIS